MMSAEARELFVYTKDKFKGDLKRISPACISPIIAVRQVINKAMEQYIKKHCTHCTQIKDVFSADDFKQVSEKIYNEIMNNEL